MRLISRSKEQQIIETLAAQTALIQTATGTGAQQHSLIAQQAATIAQQAVRLAQLEVHVEALVISTLKRIYGQA